MIKILKTPRYFIFSFTDFFLVWRSTRFLAMTRINLLFQKNLAWVHKIPERFLVVLATLLLLSTVKWSYGICCQMSHFLTVSLTKKFRQGLSNKRCDKHLQRTRNHNYSRNQNATELYKDDTSQKSFLGRIGTWGEIKM